MGTSQRCRYATVLWSTVAGLDEAFQEVVNKKGKQEREQGKGGATASCDRSKSKTCHKLQKLQ